MKKVWTGVIILALLLGFAWASFDRQRAEVEPTVTPAIQVLSPLVPEVHSANLLPTITPSPMIEGILLPQVDK